MKCRNKESPCTISHYDMLTSAPSSTIHTNGILLRLADNVVAEEEDLEAQCYGSMHEGEHYDDKPHRFCVGLNPRELRARIHRDEETYCR